MWGMSLTEKKCSWKDRTVLPLTLEKMSHANLMRDHPLRFPSPMASNSLEFPRLRKWLGGKVSQSNRSWISAFGKCF